MKQWPVFSGGAAAIAVAVSFLVGKYGLALPAAALTILCAALGLLAAAAAAVILWLRIPAAPQSSESQLSNSSDDLDALIQEANRNLARTKAGIGVRPVLFVIGPKSTTKTSVILNSGVEVEAVAGHVSDGTNVAPTQVANLLLMQDTIIVDVGGSVLDDGKRWADLVRRFRSGLQKDQSARSAVVCVPCDALSTTEEADGLAQTLRLRLREAAETLGVRLPLYVLFTRADALAGFAEYMSPLTEEEAMEQVLGATFPVRPQNAGGLHIQEATKKFGDTFESLFRSLADRRVEQISREHALAKRPIMYEFPREFRKLKSTAVRFLTELDRPTQLAISPFIRGFYFCGVRPVLVMETSVASRVPAQQAHQSSVYDATTMFRVADFNVAPANVTTETTEERKLPQWIFLRPLFRDLLLQDAVARLVSGPSVHVSRRVRFALASAIGTIAVASILVLVSLFGNRNLFLLPESVGRGVAALPGETSPAASLDQLRELDSLRSEIEKLTEYRQQGHPWRLNWGLYSGEGLREPATRVYFDRFWQLLFGSVQRQNIQRLRSLPSVKRETDEYPPTYDALKAYLVTTSEHARQETEWSRDWLVLWLQEQWNRIQTSASADQRSLAQRQFVFYASKLRQENPFTKESEADTVAAARAHLQNFSGVDQFYNMIRSRARATSQPVRFAAHFPDAAPLIKNTYSVPGEFTAAGWKSVTKQLHDMQFGNEEWVLGKANLPIQNRAKLRDDLAAAYTRDYVAEWTRYLRATSMGRYDGLADAASKLRVLSQTNASPLLAVLWLASRHTEVDPKITREFAAVHAVVPSAPDDLRNFVSPTSQEYTRVLSSLAVATEGVVPSAAASDPAAAATLRLKRSESLGLVSNIAGVLPRGVDDAPVKAVGVILLEPIKALNIPDPFEAAAADMNAAGRMFCAEWQRLSNKYPFNSRATAEVTRQELASVFARQDGRLWKLEAALNRGVQFDGSQYVYNPSSGVHLNPTFIQFFDQAGRLGRAMYPSEGSVEPQLKYTLTWEPSDQITSMKVTLDEQPVTFSGQMAASRTFVWTAAADGQAKIEYKVVGGSTLGGAYPRGPWSLFRFIGDAERHIVQGMRSKVIWVVSAGLGQGATQVNGKALTYQFVIDPSVVTPQSLAAMRCVSHVTSGVK